MNELIIVKPENCVGCNACIRECPAPEANKVTEVAEDKFIITVNPAKCTACSECVKTCSHGARDYIDDTMEAMAKLNHEEIIVMVAPSIKAVFPNKWKNVLNWFREQGCLIYDVSFGADICTWAHLKAIDANDKPVITQPCPAIVKYIETYQPKLLSNLSKIHSPMLCEAVYIKKYLHKNNKILALSPCVAKKNEFMETGLIEYNVTYKKLMEYFELNDIIIRDDNDESLTYDFDGGQGLVGGNYPAPGGLKYNLQLHQPDLNIVTAEGVHNVYRKLDGYANLEELLKPQVFDVLSCEYGCCIGGGTGFTNDTPIFPLMKSMRDVENEARARRKTVGSFFGRGGKDLQFKKFDDELAVSDFIRTYIAGIPTRTPTNEELEPIYQQLGKEDPKSRTINCNACGHTTCERMAIAIFRGLDIPRNCAIHAKQLAVHSHAEIAEKHSNLTDIADRCKALSDEMIADMKNITSSMTNIRNANSDTTDRASAVHNLLDNVIQYCKANDTMNQSEMEQLIQILQTTLGAFDSLTDSIKSSNGSTLSVDSYVLKIDSLIKDINKTLNENS